MDLHTPSPLHLPPPSPKTDLVNQRIKSALSLLCHLPLRDEAPSNKIEYIVEDSDLCIMHHAIYALCIMRSMHYALCSDLCIMHVRNNRGYTLKQSIPINTHYACTELQGLHLKQPMLENTRFIGVDGKSICSKVLLNAAPSCTGLTLNVHLICIHINTYTHACHANTWKHGSWQ